MIIASNVLLAIALILMTIGMIGLFRAKGFYRRLLTCALIDTIGFLFLLIGLIFRAPSLSFALKIILLLVVIFLTAPLISHKLGRSSYMSGHLEETEEIHE